MSRIKKEKEIVDLMIRLYCSKIHESKDGLCNECQDLLEYAHKRLSCCRFGENKGPCGKCPVRCYRQDMREQIRAIMRFSGPRLLVYKPHEFIRHVLK